MAIDLTGRTPAWPAPDATGARSAPDATGARSAPDATGARSAPDATGARSEPDATGARSAPDLYVLHIVMWDLHAARRLRDRLVAAGVDPQAVAVRGRRTEDGLQEAEVRSWRRMTTRWRMNVAVVLAAALIVGLPLGASTGTLLLGEHVWAATAGAVLGGVGLGALGLFAVWGDHFQRFASSRNTSRVEGHLAVTGDTAIVRAELLLTTTDDVRQVTRLPPGSDPLGW